MNILGISGSPSASSRTSWLVQYALDRLDGGAHRLLEVRKLPAEALVTAEFQHPAVQHALAAVASADLVVVGTPIYKAAYSGLLKLFLDLLPPEALRGKTVLPLATGGSAAHLLALDYALKPVLSVLGARDILDGVFAVDTQIIRDAQGSFAVDAELTERLDRSLHGVRRHSGIRSALRQEGAGPALV